MLHLHKNNSSVCEIFMFILLDILSVGMNLIPSLLIDFVSVVIQFLVLKTGQVTKFTAVVVALFLGRWMFTVIKKPNVVMNVNVSTGHYKLFKTVLMIPVVTCIFMCDFKSIWQDKFDKTLDSGISLMDIGVIGFIFVNAFSKNIPKYAFLSKKAGVMFTLGIIRLLVVFKLKYDVEIREYGKHLNFYFILAIIETMHNIYKKMFNFMYLFDTVFGIGLLTVYNKYVRFVSYSSITERRTLLALNMEGLYSIVPLFAFFLIANDFGRKYDKITWRYLFSFVYLVISGFVFVFYVSYATHKSVTLNNIISILTNKNCSFVSKRATNLGYILWALFANFFCFITTFTVCKLSPHAIHHNLLVEFVSRNMFLIFIVGNIGIIFSKFMHYEQSTKPSMVVLIYLFLIFVVLGTILRIFRSKSKGQSESINGQRQRVVRKNK